jgi:hypothetical protein
MQQQTYPDRATRIPLLMRLPLPLPQTMKQTMKQTSSGRMENGMKKR